ncbi:MAG: hypothetical protein Q9180_004553, partial [Flavoplaca navasiana]
SNSQILRLAIQIAHLTGLDSFCHFRSGKYGKAYMIVRSPHLILRATGVMPRFFIPRPTFSLGGRNTHS